ncbi:MAG: 4'-phosphopantetheinyl transferase superfamily protein [Salinivirgaceae bacterium]|jgi:4'-phosphopantetheinyl transferase|nr:4'-phosphopantetheinyl transferase superfamily protein [Salinivirgaceae bacterium]
MANNKVAAWKNLEDFPTLSHGEIHIWQVSTDNTATNFVDYTGALSEAELSKVHFFESKHARNSYVASQGALRQLLSGYLGISPKLVNIGRQKKGKPYSLDYEGLYFNLSNSGNLAVIAFSRDSELGIDIEQMRHLPDLDEMIHTNFTSSEIKFINTKPEERLRRFFRFWTVKESYLKAIGEGMRLAPENIEFSMDNESIRLLSVKGVSEQEDWHFKEFSILADYVGTLTYDKANSILMQMEL